MTVDIRGVLWAAYLAVSLLATLVYVVLPLDPLPDGVVYDLFGLVAVGAILLGARLHRPRSMSAWYLIALSQLLFVLGDVMWTVFDSVLHIEPWPSVADGFYLAGYPVLATGVLKLIRARGIGRDRKALIDASIVTLGLGVLAWVFLIDPYVDDRSLSVLGLAISVAYPLGDLLVMAVAIRLVTGGGFRSAAFRFLGGSLLLLLFADVVYAYQQATGSYEQGGWLDGLWLGSYALLAVAALHPQMVRLSSLQETVSPELGHKRLAVLAGAGLLAPMAMLFQARRGFEPHDVWVLVLSAGTLFLLVVARLAGLVRELDGALVQLEGLHEERERLMHRTMQASEEERVRIAAELHDGPLQRLAELGFGLERVGMRMDRGDPVAARELLQPLKEDLAREVQSIRTMMVTLRPPSLDEQGLESALRDAAESFEARTGTSCRLRVDLSERLDAELETVLYRVAQEALRNVDKHAGATDVGLELRQQNGNVQLKVYDDGLGFDTRSLESAAAEGHLGIVAMRELVRMAGGSFELRSRRGSGTTLVSVLPRGNR